MPALFSSIRAIPATAGPACGLSSKAFQAEARQEQLLVLGVPQEAGVRYHNWGNGSQPLDDRACVIEPTHMGVAGGETAMRQREAWLLLDREAERRHGLTA